jgi:hypothetical protein
MDSFVHDFQAAGGSMISVAKGNRSPQVREACKKHGGSISPPSAAAANLAEHCIKKVEVLEYPELGMEAIWRIEVENFPAFIVIDDKGNDFSGTQFGVTMTSWDQDAVGRARPRDGPTTPCRAHGGSIGEALAVERDVAGGRAAAQRAAAASPRTRRYAARHRRAARLARAAAARGRA